MSDLVTGNEHYYNGYKDGKADGRAEAIEEVLTILKTHHMFRTCEDNFVPSIEVKTYTYLFEKFKKLKEQIK